jgi:hypothetical protein
MTTLAATPQTETTEQLASDCLRAVAALDAAGRLDHPALRARILEVVTHYLPALNTLRAQLREERRPIIELRRKRIQLNEGNQLTQRDIQSQLDQISVALQQLSTLQARLVGLIPARLRERYKFCIDIIQRLRALPGVDMGRLVVTCEGESLALDESFGRDSWGDLQTRADGLDGKAPSTPEPAPVQTPVHRPDVFEGAQIPGPREERDPLAPYRAPDVLATTTKRGACRGKET